MNNYPYHQVAFLVYPDETLILCAVCGEPFCELNRKYKGPTRAGFVMDGRGGLERRWGWSFQVFDCETIARKSFLVPICCVCADLRPVCPVNETKWDNRHVGKAPWHSMCGNGWNDRNTAEAWKTYDWRSREQKVAEQIEKILAGAGR